MKPVSDDPFAAAGLELRSAPTAQLNQAFSNAIVKGFLNGFRLTTMMKVNGKIEETNSTNRPKPDSIVLSDLDFGKLATSKDFDRAVAEKWGYDRMMAESPLAARGLKLNEKIHVHFK